jgi:uncharacterized protein YndB with AHSA1/START domain
MIEQQYSITVPASAEHLWQTMLDEDNYRKWIRGFSPNSCYIGKWAEGETMYFLDPAMGGTRALIEKFDPYREIRVRHIAVVDPSRNEDIESDMARKWCGTTEHYEFVEDGEGATTLTVHMHVDPEFESMLRDGWHKSLQLLRELF